MLCMSSTDTLEAEASAADVQYTFEGDVAIDGIDNVGTDPLMPASGTIALMAAEIWPAMGIDSPATTMGASTRLMFYNPDESTLPGIQIKLYKNGSTFAITTFLIPPGGSATFDGIEPRVFNKQGTRQ